MGKSFIIDAYLSGKNKVKIQKLFSIIYIPSIETWVILELQTFLQTTDMVVVIGKWKSDTNGEPRWKPIKS